MATRIQDLFLVQAQIDIASNEDLDEGIAFYQPDGVTPISLDGIAFVSVARTSRDSLAPYLGLATVGAQLVLPPSTPRGLILVSGNVMALYAPVSLRGRRPFAGSFLLDVIASADGVTKRVVDGVLNITQGVT